MPQDPSALGSVFAEGLTDNQITALDAIEKANYIRQLVAEAVEKADLNPTLAEDELRLLMDYREWKSSVQSVSGVFHWRRREGK